MPRQHRDRSEFVVVISGLPHSLAGPNSWKPVKDLVRSQIIDEPGKVNMQHGSPTESRVAVCSIKTEEHARLTYERLSNYVWDDGSVLTTSLWRADQCLAGDSRNGTRYGQPSFIQGARMRGGQPLPGGPFHGQTSSHRANGSFDQTPWNPNAIAQALPQLQIQPPITGVDPTTGAGFLAYPAVAAPDFVLYPDHVHQRHQYFAEIAFRQFQPGQVAQYWPAPSVPSGSYMIPVVPAGLQGHRMTPGRETKSTLTSSIPPSYAGPPSNHAVSRGFTSHSDQRPRNRDRRTVIVQNLAYEASQKDVELHLGSIGQIEDCQIQKDRENAKRCRAVATFSTHGEATAAVDKLNLTRLKGREIQLRLWKEESSALESSAHITATSTRNPHLVIVDGSVESDALSPERVKLEKK